MGRKSTKGTPVSEQTDRPNVRDTDGHVYEHNPRTDGWSRKDEVDDNEPDKTFRALQQEVPDGELHVDRDG